MNQIVIRAAIAWQQANWQAVQREKGNRWFNVRGCTIGYAACSTFQRYDLGVAQAFCR